MIRPAIALAAVLVLGSLSCSHTSPKTDAQPARAAKSGMERRMDEQWNAYREALSAAPGQKLTEADLKRRHEARDRATFTEFQNKQFGAGSYEKKFYDARTVEELKMFPSKPYDARTSDQWKKSYATKTLDQPRVERRSYDIPDGGSLQTRRYTTNKLGLRNLTDWQQKQISPAIQSAEALTRPSLGQPTKATDVGSPSPKFKTPGAPSSGNEPQEGQSK